MRFIIILFFIFINYANACKDIGELASSLSSLHRGQAISFQRNDGTQIFGAFDELVSSNNGNVFFRIKVNPRNYISVSADKILLKSFRIPSSLDAPIYNIISRIKEDRYLAKEAKAAGLSHQEGLDRLVKALSVGNENPGRGSHNAFGTVLTARDRSGARVYYRFTEAGIEILGKSHKYNQDKVIKRLKELYE